MAPSLKTIGLVLIPVAGLVAQFAVPKAKLLGIGAGEVLPLNNQHCVSVPELQGCEDAWVSPEHDLAYLPCTPIDTRLHWLPAVSFLNASALPPVSGDYIALLDLSTNKHQKLKLVGMPQEAKDNFHLHAIDVWRREGDGDHLTIFVNSHRPPKDRATAPEVGANSVVEIFETRIGSPELQWVKTVGHELMRTPNNVVATGPRSFYFSNDHRRKVHWARKFSLFYSENTDLIHCDASSDSSPAHCIVAADDVHHPNGIAKGPKDLLYSVSSGEGLLSVWEMQSGDKSLVPVDTVTLPHVSDNVHVGPEGSIYIATFPRPFELFAHFGSAGKIKSSVEVWRVRNETSEKQFYGTKYSPQLVFSDNGNIVSGATTAAPYKNKLILTGVMSDKVAICEIPQ